ncbi:T9SS type A sorting domain-containing protein [candidate division KSB1 bacterium]|nr:T9SS type A sorting domain-containing protein [candidate division KSB1 bacterium]
MAGLRYLRRGCNVFVWLVIVLSYIFSTKPVCPQSPKPIVHIAHTNHPNATAYAGSRKIVRTQDDQRFVVYEDYKLNQNQILMTKSLDGRKWAEPAFIAEGMSPAIAIDARDNLYLVWQDQPDIRFAVSTDQGVSWDRPIEKVNWDTGRTCSLPVIEAGLERVHIAFQQADAPGNTNIYYVSYELPLSVDSSAVPLKISSDYWDSRQLCIAANLAFEAGDLFVVWCDSSWFGEDHLTEIKLRKVSESSATWTPGLDSTALTIMTQQKLHHPVISVEWEGAFQVSWNQREPTGFWNFTAMTMSFSEAWIPQRCQFYRTSGEAWITVDDVFFKSTAVCWLDSNQVVYRQTRNEQFLFDQNISVSESDSVPARFPNLCYKTFRQDSFDVIWTEGEHPPFSICYRRMAKIYHPDGADGGDYESVINTFELMQNYPNPFGFGRGSYDGTEICYRLLHIKNQYRIAITIYDLLGREVITLERGLQAPGSHRIRWNGKNGSGADVPAGIYIYALKADDQQIQTRKIVLLR